MTSTYLLGWVVSVVLLPPQLGIHLQPHILKVDFPRHIFHVGLCHIVVRMLPVLGVREA